MSVQILPVETQKVTFAEVKINDEILLPSGGVAQVTNIEPYIYPNGEESKISVNISYYAECAGPGSCKHAYRKAEQVRTIATLIV